MVRLSLLLSIAGLSVAGLSVAGCAEPPADEETEGANQAATSRAPEDGEVEMLEGRELTFVKRIDIPSGASSAPIGETRVRDMTELGALDKKLTCAVIPEQITAAKRWIEPAAYWITSVRRVHIEDRQRGFGWAGIDFTLAESDKTTPSDFSIRCEGLHRAPLAREVEQALRASATVSAAAPKASK